MFLVLVLVACHHTIVNVTVMSPGHYIMTDDGGEAFDCKSYPDNTRWGPRCVRLNFDRNPPRNGVAPGVEAPVEAPVEDEEDPDAR